MTFHCAILTADRPGAHRCTVQCATCAAMETRLRQPGYEDAFLTTAEESARRRFNVPTEGFADAVKRRLEMGQQRYGTRYLHMPARQRARELREEAEDAGAYAVLDTQATLSDDGVAEEEKARVAALDHEIAELAAAMYGKIRERLECEDG